MTSYGTATEEKIQEVMNVCRTHGHRSIIALAGVPGTGKSYVASIAAQRLANEPLFVREVQFHQGFSYEEFIEGLRIDSSGAVKTIPGIFLEWNSYALDDPANTYVLLIEELTRANLSAVLGELMTYLEHRGRPFVSVYGRRPTYIAENLILLATFNPTDRSAIEIDSALLRRLRIVRCDPDTAQLREMLGNSALTEECLLQLEAIFHECRNRWPEQYADLMPFGHGIFADVVNEEPDLHELWEERVQYLLRRPLLEPHPFTEVIEEQYPWRVSGRHVGDGTD